MFNHTGFKTYIMNNDIPFKYSATALLILTLHTLSRKLYERMNGIEMCRQNLVVTLHAVKSLFLPFVVLNCSFLLHKAAVVQAPAGVVLTFSAQMGLNAWDICYSRLHFLL